MSTEATTVDIDQIPARLEHDYSGVDYEHSPVGMSMVSLDGRVWVCDLVRTGITAPGFPDRAVYQRKTIHGRGTLYWVLDDGELYESNAWREAHR